MARNAVKATDPIPSDDCRLEYQYPYGAGYVGLLGAVFAPGDEFDCTPEQAAILLAQEGNFVLISGAPAMGAEPDAETPPPADNTPDPTLDVTPPPADETTTTDPNPAADPSVTPGELKE